MRIAIVEDNVSVAKGIAYRLHDEGHGVDIIADGQEADLFLQQEDPDLVILDINLPGMDGVSLLKAMRARGDTRPVLLLTARSEVSDRIVGLDAGADDYLAKPFDMEELCARVRALSRRKDRAPAMALRIADLSFDPAARVLTGPNGPIDMPRREVTVFEALLVARGRTVSKQALLDHLYGTGSDADEPVVEVYVSRLRKRLKPHGLEIRMRRGLGYSLQEAKE